MSDFINELKNEHKDFNKGQLQNPGVKNPLLFFQDWYQEAIDKNCNEPNAMSISTVLEDKPTSRILYFKELLNDELVFYTNYNSEKGQAIAANPNVSLLFFWPELERQVRINGTVSKVASLVSDTYFNYRPRESQIGAWASNQSEVISDRETLEDRIAFFKEKFKDTDVPRPPHWGGYAVRPEYIEFWQGRPSRLHDRICFKRNAQEWDLFRLNP